MKLSIQVSGKDWLFDLTPLSVESSIDLVIMDCIEVKYQNLSGPAAIAQHCKLGAKGKFSMYSCRPEIKDGQLVVCGSLKGSDFPATLTAILN